MQFFLLFFFCKMRFIIADFVQLKYMNDLRFPPQRHHIWSADCHLFVRNHVYIPTIDMTRHQNGIGRLSPIHLATRYKNTNTHTCKNETKFLLHTKRKTIPYLNKFPRHDASTGIVSTANHDRLFISNYDTLKST